MPEIGQLCLRYHYGYVLCPCLSEFQWTSQKRFMTKRSHINLLLGKE